MRGWLTRARPELLILSAVSALMHFWRLFTPHAVVWDEIHFERHAGHYLAGTFYFDVHPPLGKLLYAAEARLFGLPASSLLAGLPAVQLRVLPALLGTLIVPLVYLLLRQLVAARRVATLGAFVILCENALLVDTRVALLEPYIIVFGLLAITAYFAAARRQSGQRWLFLALSALMAGFAVSVKWTGASALGVILATWLFHTITARPRIARAIGELALLVAIPVVVYVATFAIHFNLLRATGVDQSVMSARFRTTLVGDASYDPASRMSFTAKLRDLHRAKARGNTSLEYVTHSASSPWYTWPIMKHPILLWQNGLTTNRRFSLILLGNPVVWWGSLIGSAFFCAAFVSRRLRLNGHTFAILFLLGGLLLNFLPFIAIRRVMYLYHYLFALVWLVLLAVMSLGIAASWNDSTDDKLWSFPTPRSRIVYWSVAAVVLVGFVYFSPFTFAWPLSARAYDARFWVLHPEF